MDLHNIFTYVFSLNCNGFKNKANIIVYTYPNIDLFFYRNTDFSLRNVLCS